MALEDILTQANDYMNQQITLGKNLIDISKEEAAVTASNAVLYQNVGAAEIIVQKAKDTAAIQLQGAKAKAGEIFHTDLSKFAAEVAQNADLVRQTRDEQAKVLQDIRTKQSVGLTDNPMQWLINQFTVNDDIKKHNALDKIAAQATARIQEANATSKELAITQEQFVAPITAASAAANIEAIKSLATIKANDAWTKALQYNAMGYQAALNTSKEILATTFQVNSAQQQERNIQIAQEHLNLSREAFNEKKNKEGLEDGFLLQAVNAGMKLRLGEGAQELSPKDLLLVKAQLNSKTPNQFQSDLDAGINFLTTGVKQITSSPGDFFVKSQAGIKMNLPGTMDPLKKIIGDSAAKVLDPGYLNSRGINPKDSDRIKNEISAVANETLNRAAKEIIPGTKNPFEGQSVATLITSSPVVADLPLVKKVLGPQIKAGVEFDTSEKVFAAAVQGIYDKKISYNEALDLATIYQINSKSNLEAKQFTALGFTPKGDGDWYSYRTKIQTWAKALFAESEVVDMTKPAEVGKALNTRLAHDISTNKFLNPEPLPSFNSKEIRKPGQFYPDLFVPSDPVKRKEQGYTE